MAEVPAKPKEGQEGEPLTPLALVPVYANQIITQGSGTDVTLIFSRLHPVAGPNGKIRYDTAAAQPTAIVQMSPQTAKDLVLALGDTIAKMEKEFGKLSTPFSKKAEAEKK